MNHARVVSLQDHILETVLPYVPFDGWCWDGVLAATREVGCSPETCLAVYPDRLASVLDHLADFHDREMFRALKDIEPETLKMRERIELAAMARFSSLERYKEQERLALQYWMRPMRKYRGSRLLWRTSDRIWRWAGDESMDYNHYSKRVLLSGVLGSTGLAWLNDSSSDLAETRSFVLRRIENVLQVGGCFGTLVGSFKRFRGL